MMNKGKASGCQHPLGCRQYENHQGVAQIEKLFLEKDNFKQIIEKIKSFKENIHIRLGDDGKGFDYKLIREKMEPYLIFLPLAHKNKS